MFHLPLIKKIFFYLVCASLFSVFILARDLSFPYITSKVLVFRSLILLALPLYAYLVMSDRALRPDFKNPVSLAVLAFLLVNLISGLLGANWNRSLWGNFERMGGLIYLTHLTLLYFYLELLYKISGHKFQQVLKILAILGALASFYGLLTKIGLPNGLYPDDSLPARVSSFFGNPIFFASFLIFPTFLCAFFAKQAESPNSRRFWIVAFFINLIGIYLSATRGAFLGLFAGFGLGFLLWSLLNKNFKHRLYGLLCIVGALAVFLILIIASRSFPEGSVIRRLTDFGDTNTRARIVQWSAGIKGFTSDPVLGVGPENYYVIGNKYFNPEIYQYDRSWFDKPHNYLLEVLLTTGVLGFLAYLSISVLALCALYRAFRSEMLSRLGFSVLAAGIVAYQAQNLFVFDTPSASMSFFVFTAFMGFLWQASMPISDQKKEKGKPAARPAFAEYASLAVLVMVIYALYASNWLPAKAMADLNKAVANGTRDPIKAKLYFDKAFSDPMNFDYSESATKYEEFASEFSLFYQDKKDRPAVIEAVKGALSAMEKAIQRVNNDPILWFKLTNLRATLASLSQSPYDEKIEETAKTGVALAPNRVEPRYFLVQAYQLKKDFPAAVEEQYNVIKIDFNNPFNFWRLALVYRESKDMPKAYQRALYARQNGYEFRNLAEAQWLAQYYSDLNQFKELAKIYEELIKNNLADIQTRANLALVYAKMGEREKARVMALKVLELSPPAKADVEAFVKKLDSGEPF